MQQYNSVTAIENGERWIKFFYHFMTDYISAGSKDNKWRHQIKRGINLRLGLLNALIRLFMWRIWKKRNPSGNDIKNHEW